MTHCKYILGILEERERENSEEDREFRKGEKVGKRR